MRAYRLNKDEIAVVITNDEAKKIVDPDTSNIISGQTEKSLMSWIRSALDTK